ncbi:unnamed protein product, partial [Phaeothamnion confervicola]
ALGILAQRACVTAETLPALREHLEAVADSGDEGPGSGGGSGGGSAAAATSGERLNQGGGGGGGGEGQQRLSGAALVMLKSLITVVGYMLAEDIRNAADYRMVVLRDRQGGFGDDDGGGFSGGEFGGGGAGELVTSLCLWCLNSGVCFREIGADAWSVVLTSGTLSPLDSLAVGLGLDFPVRLEAGHVINVPQQCLVASVGRAGGVSLSAKFSDQNGFAYQDALGAALMEYAEVVPGGVLVFFPSYGLMHKMARRWESTGLLDRLQQVTEQ